MRGLTGRIRERSEHKNTAEDPGNASAAQLTANCIGNYYGLDTTSLVGDLNQKPASRGSLERRLVPMKNRVNSVVGIFGMAYKPAFAVSE